MVFEAPFFKKRLSLSEAWRSASANASTLLTMLVYGQAPRRRALTWETTSAASSAFVLRSPSKVSPR